MKESLFESVQKIIDEITIEPMKISDGSIQSSKSNQKIGNENQCPNKKIPIIKEK